MSQTFLLILLVLSNCVITSAKTYCLPHQECWPKKDVWNSLNISIEGRLIHLSKPKCSGVSEPRIRTQHPSCTLWDNTQHEDMSMKKPLIHPEYAVHVAMASDAQAAMNFAAAHNILLTIKTTGHSFVGTSNAAGSLLVWLHAFNKVVIDEKYDDGCTQGEMVTVQGGTTWGDAYPAVSPRWQLVGGYTLSVAVAGGFMQGGGHSPLSGAGGLAVDSFVSIDVVTADGKLVTANPCQNKDLFFALRGGGGGTWGVVTSASIRMHRAPPEGVGFNLLVPMVIAKSFLEVYAGMQPEMHPCWGGYMIKSVEELLLHLYCDADMETAQKSMKPLQDWHKKHRVEGIIWEMNKVATFWRWHTNITMPCGITVQMASRLVPMENFEGEKLNDLVDVVLKHSKKVAAGEFWIIQLGPGVKNGDPNKTSSITPAYRNAQWHVIQAAGLFGKEREDHAINMVADFQSDMAALTPGSGAYLNECSYFEPNWKQSFYGPNYDRLLEIKKKYDPDNVMRCHHCVGSDLD